MPKCWSAARVRPRRTIDRAPAAGNPAEPASAPTASRSRRTSRHAPERFPASVPRPFDDHWPGFESRKHISVVLLIQKGKSMHCNRLSNEPLSPFEAIGFSERPMTLLRHQAHSEIGRRILELDQSNQLRIDLPGSDRDSLMSEFPSICNSIDGSLIYRTKPENFLDLPIRVEVDRDLRITEHVHRNRRRSLLLRSVRCKGNVTYRAR